MKLFTVYDSKAEAYLSPFYSRSRGEATRSFIDACNDPKTQFNKYPADFTLFELGDFDESSAKFKIHPTPISLGLASEFKRPDPHIPDLFNVDSKVA